MAFGDALRDRINEFRNTTTRSTAGGRTPFHIKLKEVAIDDLQRNYPDSISSADFIEIYRGIFASNITCIPADKRKTLGNGQPSYWVTIRNAFSSNRGPRHPDCLANAREVITSTVPNGRGNGVVYQANPTFLGNNPSANAFSSITSFGDGTTLLTDDDDLTDGVDDAIEQEKIRRATTLTPAQVAAADNRPVDYSRSNGTSQRADTNYSLSKTVLEDAGFTCELSVIHIHTHNTFSTNANVPYVEAHHLIPMKYQRIYTDNLDRSTNIVCLCPTCHKAIHYGNDATKKMYLEPLYNARRAALSAVGFDMGTDIDDFIAKYYS